MIFLYCIICICERRCCHIARPDNEESSAREYSRLVTRYVRRYSPPGFDRDDLYQEGMIGLLKAMRSYDPEKNDNFEAYAALCVKRRIIDALRRAPGEIPELFEGRESGDPYRDPLTEIVAMESAREIHDQLYRSLSPFEARVYALYMDGFTNRETARMLSREVRSVDNAVGRIRKKLDKYLTARRKQD